MEAQDRWLDQLGRRHRAVVDAPMGPDASMAMMTAAKFYYSNEKGYGLDPASLGVLVVLRHASTPFGFNDAMWKKYHKHFIKMAELKDGDASRASSQNPYLAGENPNDAEAVTLARLAAKGAMFPVCGLATRGIAAEIAEAHKLDAAAVEAELSGNLIPNGHKMASGIIALARAQELGFVQLPTS